MYTEKQLEEFQKLGEKRIEAHQKGNSSYPSKNSYSPYWGNCWKLSFEYKVSNFPSEAGFFVDILGFEFNVFTSTYLMLTNPDQDSFFSIIQTKENDVPTPPESIRMHFVVKDIFSLVNELRDKHSIPILSPELAGEGSNLYSSILNTPHGVKIELWGSKKIIV